MKTKINLRTPANNASEKRKKKHGKYLVAGILAKVRGLLGSLGKWKKRLAVLLIGVVLMPSFTPPAQALFGFWESPTVPDVQREKLVSILVEERLLDNTKLKHKIEQYATNVQTTVNGKAILIPIPRDASPLDIYEGNAHLYFSGVDSDGRSQLVGTVLIGDVPLPIIEKKGNLWPTIFPYVDFEDPIYRWNTKKERFIFQGGNAQPEIWHGVIRSDARMSEGWDKKKLQEKREDELISFFETNNQVHAGDISFSKKVFFADLKTQSNGLGETEKRQYESWIANIEDVAYMRFTKHWAQEVLSENDTDAIIDTNLLPESMRPDPDAQTASDLMKNIPDVHTKLIIENAMKRYFEAWKNTLSLQNGRIEKSGRWDPEDIESTITLISTKDEHSAVVLKEWNDFLESVLDTAIQANNVAADIKVKTKKSIDIDYILPTVPPVPMVQSRDKDLYWNGVLRSEMTVDDCSLLRGSPRTTEEPHAQMVEANRAYNPLTASEDYPTAGNPDYLCENMIPPTGTNPNWTALDSWWNDDDDDDGTKNYEDIYNDVYEGCCALNTNLNADTLTYENNYCETGSEWVIRDYLGLGNLTPYPPAANDNPTLTNQYREHVGATEPLFDITATKEVLSGSTGAEGCAPILDVTGDKTVNSLSFHKEPTAETISAQLGNMGTIAMPVDSPRGFSFYDAGWTFHRIDYFNAFDFIGRYRDISDEVERKNLIRQEILTALRKKITEINAVNAGTPLPETLFNTSINNLDQVLEAIVWMDKDISKKNRIVFEKAFSATNVAQEFFDDNDFHDGYEFSQIVAKDSGSLKEGIELSFEQGKNPKSNQFQDTLLEEAKFAFDEGPVHKDQHFDFSEQSGMQMACNGKNILTWFPCFLEWLLALPEFLTQKFIILPDLPQWPSQEEALSGEVSTAQQEPKILTPGEATDTTFTTVENVEASIQNIHIGVGDKMPIILEIDLKNKTGSTVPDGSEKEVSLVFTSSNAQKFFDIFPNKKINPNGGKAVFTLFPQETSVGGSFSLQVKVDGEIQQSIPVLISMDTLSVQFEQTQVIANTKEGVLLRAKVKNKDRMISHKKDGEVLVFTSDWGRFDSGGRAMIRDGMVEILFFPGIRSGKATVWAQDTKKSLPLAQSEITIIPEDPDAIVLDTETEILIHGADFVPVRATLVDKFGNTIRKSGETLFWNTVNIEVQGMENSETFETTLTEGQSKIFIRPQSKLSFAEINVSLGGGDAEIIQKEEGISGAFNKLKKESQDFQIETTSKIKKPQSIEEEEIFRIPFVRDLKSAGEIKKVESVPALKKNLNKGKSSQEQSLGRPSLLQTALIRDLNITKQIREKQPRLPVVSKLDSLERNIPPGELGIKNQQPEASVQIQQQKRVLTEKSALEAVEKIGLQPRMTDSFDNFPPEKDQEQITQQKRFRVPPKVILLIEAERTTIPAGTEEPLLFYIEAQTESGERIPKEISVGISSDKEAVGSFPKTFLLHDGVGTVSFFAGSRAGEEELSFGSPGFETNAIVITVEADDPVKIVTGIDAQTMDIDDEHAEINMNIQVVDRFGNQSVGFSDKVYLLPNEPEILPESERTVLIDMGIISEAEGEQIAIRKAAAEARAGGTSPDTSLVQIEGGWSVKLSEGVAQVRITPTGGIGNVLMSVKAPNLVPAALEFSITDSLTLNEIEDLSPKVLFTLLLGFDSGNPLPDRNAGSRLLFSGKTQAVGTLIAPPHPAKQIGFLTPEGVLTGSLEPEIKMKKNWFEVALIDVIDTLGTVRVQFSKDVEFFVKKEKGSIPGIYFIPEGNQEENLTRTGKRILFEGNPFFEITAQGGIQPLREGLALQAIKGSYLDWEVRMGEESIGVLSVIPEGTHMVSVKKEAMIPLQEAGIFVIQEVSEIQLASLFTGKTTLGEKGIVFLDPAKKETQTKILGSPEESAEDVQENQDIIWTDGWKPGTLFAAGNTVGTSTQWDSSDAFLLLGDPTVRIPTPNERSSLGLTKDIGTPLWKSPEGPIDQIIVADINGDEVPDILNRVGKKLFALYQENSEIDNFRDTGPILRFSDGVKTVVSVHNDQDNFTDLLQLNEKGELVFHKNRKGTFTREKATLNGFEGTIEEMIMGNINDDIYTDDLIFSDANKNLWVAFGTEDSGYFDPIEKIGSFAPTLETIHENYVVAEQQDWGRRKYFDTDLFPNLGHVFISHEGIEQEITDQTPSSAIKKIRNEELLPANTFERGLGEGGFHLNFGGVPISESVLGEMTSSLQGSEDGMDKQLAKIADIALKGKKGTFQKTFLAIPFQTQIDTEFTLKSSDNPQLEINDVLQGELTFTPKTTLSSFEFLIPNINGLELVPDSFACDTCDEAILFRKDPPKDEMLWGYIEKQLPAGVPLRMTWNLSVNALQPLSFQVLDFAGNDTIDDIFIGWNEDEKQKIIQYVSYPQNNNNSIFKHSKTIIDVPAIVEASAPDQDVMINTVKGDADGNGVPDLFDTFGVLNFAALSCSTGCGLPLPSLVIPPFAAGKQSFYLPPIAIELPANPVPTPALSFVTAPPYVNFFLPQGGPGSVFRMYIMPTTTGKVGMGFCVGPYALGMNAKFPAGNCITVFPPIMESLGVCSTNNSEDETENSLRDMSATTNDAEFKPKYDKISPNISIHATEIISDWINAQMDEWNNIKLPTPKLWIPKLPQKEEFFKKREDGKDSTSFFAEDTKVLGRGLWKKLEEKSWITIQPKRYTFPYPEFPHGADQKEVSKYKIQWKAWKKAAKDTKDQIKAVKDRYDVSCLNPNTEEKKEKCKIFLKNISAFAAFQSSLDQNVQAIENNWEAIKSFKKAPEVLKKLFKDDERVQGELTRLGKQFQKYAEEIQTYVTEWLDMNKEAIKKWKKFAKELKEFFKGFNDLLEPFMDFTADCPTCSVERGSSSTILINFFLGGIKLPIIPAPRLPDILLDFSHIDFTVEIPVPEIEFQPIAVGYPDIPAPPKLNIPSLNLEKSIDIPGIPVIPVLPAMPDIDISIPIPNLPLPALPVLLDPPGLPIIFVDLQPIVNLLKNFIKLFCALVQGLLPVPEGYLAGHVQQMTNRSILFGLDFTTPALSLNLPQIPEISDIAITIEAHLKLPTGVFEIINKNLGMLQEFDECMVNSFVQTLKGALPQQLCSLGGGDSTAYIPQSLAMNKVKYNIVATIDPHLENENVSLQQFGRRTRNETLGFLAHRFQPHKNIFSTLAPRRFSRWLTSLINVGEIPTEAPIDFDTDVRAAEQNDTFTKDPSVYYFDPATGSSEKVTEFPTENLTAYTFADIGNDSNDEILYAFGNELFLKYRVVPVQDESDLKKKYEQKYGGDYEDRFGNIIQWDFETFREKFAPAAAVKTTVETDGATLEFERIFKKTSYFEWVVSDRPDFVFEKAEKASQRVSNQWERHAFLLRPTPVRYEIRPMTAQIKDIKGAPLLYASPAETIPRLKQSDCDDEFVAKPFFSTESLLVGIDNSSRFEIRVPPRPGRPEQFEEKVLKKGEETIVEYGEICLTRGDIQRIAMTEKALIPPQENTYLSSGSRFELGPNDRVKLEMFDGTEVTIYGNEKYTFQVFDREHDMIRAFQKMEAKNQYGFFQAFQKNGESFFLSKFLHDPQREDDAEKPYILVNGGTTIAAKVFQPISIDASRTQDKEGGIAHVWWDLYPQYDEDGDGDSENDQDFPERTDGTEKNPRELLKVVLPAYEQAGTFSVVLHVVDPAGNEAKKIITINVDIPTPVLQEASVRTASILGSIRDALPDVPITIERNRSGEWEPIREKSIYTDAEGDFSLINLNTSGGIEIQTATKSEAFEILENGRPILLDDKFDIVVRGATQTRPTSIILRDEQEKPITSIAFSLSGKEPVVLDQKSLKFSTEASVHVLDRDKNDKIIFEETPEGNVLISSSNTPLALIDKRGDFYGSLELQLQRAKNENDPVVFEIRGEKESLLGEFVILLGTQTNMDLVREKNKTSKVDFLSPTNDNLLEKNEN